MYETEICENLLYLGKYTQIIETLIYFEKN
jgi:hypothetical protein